MLFNSVLSMLTLPVFLRDLKFKYSRYWVPHMKCLFARVCFVLFFLRRMAYLGGEALVAVVFWPAGLDASFIYRGLKLFFLWPFPGCRGRGWLVGCVQGRELCAWAHRLPRFTLLVSFRDALLVVSILDLVYDCHLRPLLQS